MSMSCGGIKTMTPNLNNQIIKLQNGYTFKTNKIQTRSILNNQKIVFVT
jgi:hypothetical protein